MSDDKPVAQPYRRIPPSQYEEVKAHIKDLLAKNIIKESISPVCNKEKTKQKSNKQMLLSWTDECSDAFTHLKDKLTTSPILEYADYKSEFILETDASFRGLGAVLMQKQGKDLRVIAYASRTLRPSERNDANYSSAKLELLAVKWAVTEKLKNYLLCSKFEIITDNNPLSHLQTSGKLGAVEQRWAAQLAQFNFTISYRSGKLNGAADALSRLPSYTTDVPTDLRVIAYQRTVESIEYEVEEKHEQLDKDGIFKGLCNQVSVLPRYSNSDMNLMQNSDNTIKQFLISFNEQRKPSSSERMKESPKVISMLRQKDRMFLKNGILYRKVTDPQQGETHQFVVPEALQKQVLEMLHEQAGHQE
ncbi:unnamed protein product [Mytilus coruscus]|uniref:Reverse transcriptase/retrotransposon-derived protein RNase H-like domain-containing protein n=1 Tax=Mytilus coruscus TaxID=42192 RepID=A0A6J8AGH2_MYTCO|nr:unnamed protein product [Mytilus coruscus]